MNKCKRNDLAKIKVKMSTNDCDATNATIIIRNACKTYGSRKNRYTVFDNLNMTVLKGHIYGLLGSSGCGKTTLLNCILGMNQLNSGDIWVLGGKPGTNECGIPGPLVGYMPQETSLMKEFTVRDAVYYFGRIFELSETKICERFEFLTKILDLPPSDKFIKDCSGGQQRRVSFAAALVHEPELLILDEPTVGLDAVLRASIWEHLIDLTKTQNTTVIITTHYIDEARNSDCIGLMRNGTLMAEESPDCLLRLFNVETLEEVFFKLSEYQSNKERVPQIENEEYLEKRKFNEQKYSLKIGEQTNKQNNLEHSVRGRKKRNSPYSLGRMKALLLKNVNQILRNPIGLYFIIFYPILQMIAFCYGIGLDPTEIKLVIVNEESNWENCRNFTKHNPVIKYNEIEEICEFSFVSCRFLELIDDKLITKIFFDDLESGKKFVANGNAIGVLHIAENFTKATELRMYDSFGVDDYELESSEFKFFMDMTQWNVGLLLKTKMHDTFKEYVKSLKKECEDFVDFYQFPLRIKTLYGNLDDPYKNFVYPAVLITLVFYVATSLTCTEIIDDRLEGIWHRSLVAGVTHGELLITHFMAQFPLVLLQVIEYLCIVIYLFDLNVHGNVVLLFMFVLLNGICGMLNGLLVSIVSPSHVVSHGAVAATLFLMTFSCGLIWPAEAMPDILRWSLLILPCTIPVTAVRHVVNKGWSLAYFEVSLGLIVLLVWIFIYSILSYIILKRKN